jgi:hypothetical protein
MAHPMLYDLPEPEDPIVKLVDTYGMEGHVV